MRGEHPQDLINSQLLDRCDLLIAILWSRLGTPTNSDLSGTVQEIREFSETKGADRVLIFFCDRDIPNSSDLDQVKAVRSFKDSIKSQGLYTPYTEVSEFGSLFRHQLDLAMNKVLEGEEFDAVSARATGNSEIVFLPEANTILAAAAMADRTTITLIRVLSGHMLCWQCCPERHRGRPIRGPMGKWIGTIRKLWFRRRPRPQTRSVPFNKIRFRSCRPALVRFTIASYRLPSKW